MAGTLHIDMPADHYHQLPSLSSTVVRDLILKTPAHARYAKRPATTAMDTGTALHQLLLGEDRIDVLDYPDWRKTEAREHRDQLRAQGRVPMLAHAWEEANTVAEGIRATITRLDVDPKPFTAGKREQTVEWTENNVDCRARLDWLRDDHTIIDDLKTTGKLAAPRKWAAGMFRDGLDMQAAFYTRAIHHLSGHQPVFRFVIAETYPPYAVSVVKLSEAAMFSAQVKIDTAIQLWRDCLERDEWPGYDTDIYVADLPAWLRPDTDAWSNVDLETVPF